MKFRIDYVGGPKDGLTLSFSWCPQDGQEQVMRSCGAVYRFHFSRFPRAAFVFDRFIPCERERDELDVENGGGS